MRLGRRHLRLACAAFAAAALSVLPAYASGAEQSPEPLLAGDLGPGTCASSHYPECHRLRFSFPVLVTPGANYQTIMPSIGKPIQDGYLVRINANLVRGDGSVPPVDLIHLHHAVWLAIQPPLEVTPFFGVGEEKTVMTLPNGYGWRVRPIDTWLLNYMIHNLTPVPELVHVVWDVDFVPREAAERKGIVPAVPLAVEIRRDDRPLMPIFNVQRGFGQRNPATGRRECTYPRDRCAAFDPYGEAQPGNGVGYDFTVPERLAGTIVSLIGHLHPGGLRDELSLVRRRGGKDVERPLFTFDAVYYNRGDPVSWDFGMTVTPPGWRVQIRPGDRLRLNAVYDADHASWYEGMGIVYGFVAPGDTSGLNPFRKARFPRRGKVTHGHLSENDNHGGDLVRPLPKRDGPLVSDLVISNFTFERGDLSRVEATGIPRVRADGTLTFRNYDALAGIWHTITTCRPPCTGTTGVGYPIADDMPPLDSLELGWTPPPIDVTQSSGQTADYSIQPRRDGLAVGKTYTYFCRIHPFMRGAFKVVR